MKTSWWLSIFFGIFHLIGWHHVTYLNRFRAQNLLSKNMIYWSLVLFGQFYLIFSFRFVSRFKKYFPFLRDLQRKVSIRYRRNQFQRIFWGTQKSQNFNFILEKNLLNKKVVFLHINLALNTQNCQKINFKWCFGPKTYFLKSFCASTCIGIYWNVLECIGMYWNI